MYFPKKFSLDTKAWFLLTEHLPSIQLDPLKSWKPIEWHKYITIILYKQSKEGDISFCTVILRTDILQLCKSVVNIGFRIKLQTTATLGVNKEYIMKKNRYKDSFIERIFTIWYTLIINSLSIRWTCVRDFVSQMWRNLKKVKKVHTQLINTGWSFVFTYCIPSIFRFCLLSFFFLVLSLSLNKVSSTY